MRFFGEVGYLINGSPVEIRPGVWEDQIIERTLMGDVQQGRSSASDSASILTKDTLQTTISVVADAFALENFTGIKYVRWAGSVWSVTSVEILRPRLTLHLGGVYNGPTASVADGS